MGDKLDKYDTGEWVVDQLLLKVRGLPSLVPTPTQAPASPSLPKVRKKLASIRKLDDTVDRLAKDMCTREGPATEKELENAVKAELGDTFPRRRWRDTYRRLDPRYKRAQGQTRR